MFLYFNVRRTWHLIHLIKLGYATNLILGFNNKKTVILLVQNLMTSNIKLGLTKQEIWKIKQKSGSCTY